MQQYLIVCSNDKTLPPVMIIALLLILFPLCHVLVPNTEVITIHTYCAMPSARLNSASHDANSIQGNRTELHISG